MKTSRQTLVRSSALALTAVAAVTTMTACGGGDASSTASPSAAATTSATASSPAVSSSAAPLTPPSTSPAADTAPFCAAFASIPSQLNADDADAVVTAAHTFGDALAKAPVPSGMPADAQDGLKAYYGVLEGLKASDIPALKTSKDPTQLFGDKVDDVKSFISYVSTTCQSEISQAQGASPSSTPTN